MLASVPSAILVGVQGKPISVEVHVSPGIPSFTVVGLPDASCREARDRVRAAILSSGLQWPQRRVTVNLAPTGSARAGPGSILPIAIALLAADGQLPAACISGLASSGSSDWTAASAGCRGCSRWLTRYRRVASSCRPGAPRRRPRPPGFGSGRRRACAVWLPSFEVRRLGPPLTTLPAAAGGSTGPDLADVRGQALGRLAVEVAAAGGHHLLLVGPPGAGKTMLAERLPGLLPPLGMQRGDGGDPDSFGGWHRPAARGLDQTAADAGAAPQRLAGFVDRRRKRRHASRRAELRPPRGVVPRRARRIPL